MRTLTFPLMLILLFPLSAQNQYRADIRIDLQEERAPVPAGLYGIFMEEIHYSFDGGIYAELIRNRSFEEGILPPGMKLVEKKDGRLKMELEKLPEGIPEDQWDMPWPWNMNCNWDPERKLIGWSLRQEKQTSSMELTEARPMNEASSLSLELKVAGTDRKEGEVSLINSGYWGINVAEGLSYDLKFYLRPGTFKGQFSVALEDESGQVLAAHSFGSIEPGSSWEIFKTRLKAEGTSPQGRFVITFKGKGDLQIDWVSLFPPTYLGKENGLRTDLVKYLEELKPDFVRYPGGCYVQGLSWESSPDWRRMVCPPEERPGMWGYWKYRSTDGFGYHEFLEFCEDIDADALYVAFAGMTVHPQNNWPLEDIDTIIEQTLGAIEYALGPADSKWGSVRAEMGHPESFPLKYVEIGNEHPQAIYGDYYVKFREAIKAKYPDLTVILSMYWSGLNQKAIDRAGDENIDMVDEHAYRNANWIRSNSDYFDKYERKPWKVYVGEYASHHSTGNLYAGMGDAVYLMMMERNGDLVKLASYAPLFVNVNEKSWAVNLIEFNASRSFAHASYYVQKVFNENRPDVNLKISTEFTPEPDTNLALMAGKIGLGSWNTRSEFSDLRIYDENGVLIYSDDFADLENWETPGIGEWKAENGVLKQNDLGQDPAMLLLDSPEFETGKVRLKAKRIDGDGGFILFFNASGMDRFLFCNYGAAGNRFSAIQQRNTPEGYALKEGKRTAGRIERDRWYDVSLVLEKDRAVMYLDGEKVSDARMHPMQSFFTAAGYDRDEESIVVKAVNYHGEPVQANIQLDGTTLVSETGRHIVISSDHPHDKNSLDNPRKIIPEERLLTGCSERFSVTLPPYSVNVLNIPAKK